MKIQLTTAMCLAFISCTMVVQHTVEAGGKCNKKHNYQCGQHFPPGGDTCSGKGCCCDGGDGTGLQVATCRTNRGDEGFTNRGCNSCWGTHACGNTKYMNIGTNACHGEKACMYTEYSTIETDACQGDYSCYHIQNANVKRDACIGEDACSVGDPKQFKSLRVGSFSVEEGSCQGKDACWLQQSSADVDYVNIGKNACIGESICKNCANAVVPDNACNDVDDGDDVTGGRCNYCPALSTNQQDTPTDTGTTTTTTTTTFFTRITTTAHTFAAAAVTAVFGTIGNDEQHQPPSSISSDASSFLVVGCMVMIGAVMIFVVTKRRRRRGEYHREGYEKVVTVENA